MNHFLEIRLHPDAEMPATVLMNAVFAKLHKRLSELKSKSIAVSFPKYGVTLGGIVRILGNETDLSQLQKADWLGGMSGYCAVSNITKVPLQTQHRTISRIQSTMTQSKLNRLLKRGSIQPEQVREYNAKLFAKGLDNPYLELQSSSNGHKHRRYIAFGEILDNPVEGEFDQFGLSKIATIPWF